MNKEDIAEKYYFSKEYLIYETEQFLVNEKKSFSECRNVILNETPYKIQEKENINFLENANSKNRIYENVIVHSDKPVYENVVLRNPKMEFPGQFIPGDILAPPKMIEPPKVKPPPPPPLDDHDNLLMSDAIKFNTTKRIKKEIQIKRSSFLGLEEPVSLVDPDLIIEKPPDVDLFLRKESKLEKSLYKRLQGSREGGLSEVESQDSGLELDRGRLSSDTWCSTYPDSGLPIMHRRQDSEVNIFLISYIYFT